MEAIACSSFGGNKNIELHYTSVIVMHCNLRTAAPSDHSHTANMDTNNLSWNSIKFMNH